MKITIVQGAFLPVPPLLGGAVEKIWHLLAREFAAHHHAVTHVSRAFPGLAASETRDGVRHLRVNGFNTPSALWRLKLCDLIYSRRCARVLQPADIIVTNTFWLPMFPSVCRKGAVYVDVQRMPKGQMRWYHRAARLRANSTAVARAIRNETPAGRDRVALIPNPLPFAPLPADALTPASARARILLYVGRLHPEKGVDLLIEAFRRLNPGVRAIWKIHIVGPWSLAEGGGGEGYLKKLQDAARGLPVEFLGPVHDPVRLSGHYGSAPLLVYPSLAAKGETFGLALLEAMAHGCVPVCSRLECFEDFIQTDVNGMTFDQAAADPAGELTRILDVLMANPEHCDRLAAKASQVNQTHAPGRIAECFLADFAQVIESGHSRPVGLLEFAP